VRPSARLAYVCRATVAYLAHIYTAPAVANVYHVSGRYLVTIPRRTVKARLLGYPDRRGNMFAGQYVARPYVQGGGVRVHRVVLLVRWQM